MFLFIFAARPQQSLPLLLQLSDFGLQLMHHDFVLGQLGSEQLVLENDLFEDVLGEVVVGAF